MKNPLTLAGIEPATFRFVAQHLNHCATVVPQIPVVGQQFLLMYFFLWRNALQWARASSLSGLHDDTQTHDTRLDSSGRVISPTQRDLYLTKHNTHNRQTSMPTSMPTAAFPASKQLQSHSSNRATLRSAAVLILSTLNNHARIICLFISVYTFLQLSNLSIIIIIINIYYAPLS